MAERLASVGSRQEGKRGRVNITAFRLNVARTCKEALHVPTRATVQVPVFAKETQSTHQTVSPCHRGPLPQESRPNRT